MRSGVEAYELVVLAAGGFAAGVVNTLAGGGSMLTVGLLVILGVPGTLANGTNRVGVLVQNLASMGRFRAEGVPGFQDALPLLVPLLSGAAIGAYAISLVSHAAFERLFGVLMLALVVPVLWPGKAGADASARDPWPPALRFVVFFAIGVYGGAIQAGVGLFVLFALNRAGFDLVTANSVKAVIIAAVSAVAVPVFVWSAQVVWPPALALALGFGLGGVAGVRLAVLGGERLIRPVVAVAVVAVAARLLGFL